MVGHPGASVLPSCDSRPPGGPGQSDLPLPPGRELSPGQLWLCVFSVWCDQGISGSLRLPALWGGGGTEGFLRHTPAPACLPCSDPDGVPDPGAPRPCRVDQGSYHAHRVQPKPRGCGREASGALARGKDGAAPGVGDRTLPPSPPTGAAAARLRSAAEPVASTPPYPASWWPSTLGSRRGLRGGGAGQPGPEVLRAASLSLSPSPTPTLPSRQYFSQADLTGRQREEGEHEATQRCARQRLGPPDLTERAEVSGFQPHR